MNNAHLNPTRFLQVVKKINNLIVKLNELKERKKNYL